MVSAALYRDRWAMLRGRNELGQMPSGRAAEGRDGGCWQAHTRIAVWAVLGPISAASCAWPGTRQTGRQLLYDTAMHPSRMLGTDVALYCRALTMKLSPLPPLNSLVAFEAAARHQSFTLAASELHVTQGAISRQVRILEEYLGKPLFTRANRSIRLTAGGLLYVQTVRSALSDITVATDDLRSWKGTQQITLATSSAMASLWLLPKIAEFQSEHEEIELRIVALEQIRDLSRVEWDIALFYCSTPPPGLQASTLFYEEVFPVCSPAYVDRYGPLETPESLSKCTLLSLEEADQDWLSWKRWYAQVGIEAPTPRRRLNINSYAMLVQAAVMGQGVALGWSKLVDDYLLQGQLVRPMNTVLRTRARFCLLESSETPTRRASVRAFREWLLDSIPKEVGDLGLA